MTIPELVKGGLQSNKDGKYHVRLPMEQLFHNLINLQRGHVKVVGTPGTGKSTTVWLSALHKARKGSRVLWVHFGRELDCAVCIMRDGDLLTPGRLLRASDAEAQIVQLLEVEDFDFIVLDGVARKPPTVFQQIQSALRTYTRNKIQKDQPCTLIYCASQGLRTDGSEVIPAYFLDGAKAPVVMSVPPWRLQEFKDAVANPEFWSIVQAVVAGVPVPETITSAIAAAAVAADEAAAAVAADDAAVDREAAVVDVAAAVENKFIISGSSARWMFGMSSEDVVADCDRYLNEVKSVKAIITDDQGAANADAK